MTDHPVCKLCKCAPNQSLSLADPGFRYNCDSHDCPIAESGLTLTPDQWTALMGVDRDARLAAIIEILAGMEGFEAQTAPEAYLQRIIKQIESVAMGEQQ